MSEPTSSRRFGLLTLVGLLAVQLGLTGCSEQLSGPDPELTGEPGQSGEAGFADPNFTCNEQIEKRVTIQGKSFAPIVEGTLKEDGVNYPDVELQRTADITGEFDGAESQTILRATGGEDSRVQWNNDTEMELRIDGELDLAPGIYDVHVINPSGEDVRKRHAFGILPRPSVETIVPDLACIAQGKRTLTVEGGPFIKKGDSLPTVDIGASEYTPTEAGDCRELGDAFGGVQACSSLTIEVASEDFDPGARDVVVDNLAPAECSSLPEEDGVKFRVAPPPEITSVEPLPLCSKQRDYRELKVNGTGFLRIESQGGTTLPTVDVAGRTFDVHRMEGCETVQDLTNETASRCTAAFIRIDAGELDELAMGTDQPLTNHTDAGHDAGADSGSSVVDTGGSSDADGGGSTDSGSADADAGSTDADTGTTDTGTTDAGDAGTDATDDAGDAGDAGNTGPPTGPTPEAELTTLSVVLTNPEPVGCKSTQEATVAVVPPPVVHDITPDPYCNISDAEDGSAQTTTSMTVTGFGFLVIDGTNPTVDIGDQTYDVESASGCTAVGGMDGNAESCTEVTVEVAADDLPQGQASVAVNNPEPANCSSEGSAPVDLTPIPTINRVEPSPTCTADAERQITIMGSDFYVVDGQVPEVSFGMMGGMMGSNAQGGTWEVDEARKCQQVAIDGETQDARRCNVVTVTVPKDALVPANAGDLGQFPVRVTNPGQTGCASTAEANLYTANAPAIDRISEDFACLEEGKRAFTISGEDFLKIDGGMMSDIRMPTVEIDGKYYETESLTDCNDSSFNGSLSETVEHCQTLSFTVPGKDLDAGDYTVKVHQPRPALCTGAASTELKIVPSPSVTDVAQQPQCSEQTDKTVTVSGTDFLVVDGASGEVVPQVIIDGQTFDQSDVTASNCEANPLADVSSRTVTRCTELTVDIDPAEVSAGLKSVKVVNPHSKSPPFGGSGNPDGCTSKETQTLRMSPPPQLANVEPEPICTAQGQNVLAANGQDLLVINPSNGARRYPTVTFTDKQTGNMEQYTATSATGCQPVGIQGDEPRAESCSQVQFAVPQDGLAVGDHRVNITNPSQASCTSVGQMGNPNDEVLYTVVPPPTLASIDPQLSCVEQGDKQFTIDGSDFLRVGGTGGSEPTVTVNNSTFQASVVDSSCTDLPDTPQKTEQCSKLTFTIPQGAVAPGDHQVIVTNPTPADCDSSNSLNLFIKPPPTVASVAPSPICTEENSYAVTIDGSDFLNVTGPNADQPDVTIGGNSVTVTAVRNCTQTSQATVETCQTLDVDVPQGLLVQPGQITDNQVVVTNPAPADCTSDEAVFEKDIPSPEITTATLQKACPNGGDDKFVVEGQFFAGIGGNTPTVIVDNQSGSRATYTNTTLGGTCTQLNNVSQTSQSCDLVRLDLSKQSGLNGGNYTVGVENPQTAQCQTIRRNMTVQEQPPEEPEIDSIQPPRTCATGGQLTIIGEDFKRGITVSIAGVPADNVTFVSSTEITATWNSGLPAGGQQVTLTNPDGCQTSSGQSAVSVLKGPLSVYVDPAVHYNQIKLSATAYFSNGQAKDVSKVSIRGPQGTVRDLNFNRIPNRSNQIRITLPDEDPQNPGSPLPAGKYDIKIAEQIGGVACGQWIDDLVTVVGNKKLALEEIEPGFGWTAESTGVRITAEQNPGAGQTQFQSTPRVYLNPVNPVVGTFAKEISGVTYNSPTELNGVVPPNEFAPGDYQVVVINPDNTVGVLNPPNGFKISEKPPPEIDTVSPGTWGTPRTLTVTVEGENFRVDPNQANPVTMVCQSGLPPNSITVDHNQTTTTKLVMQVTTDQMDEGDVCQLIVENPDGTKGKYSPIGTVNPAYNFISFTDGTSFKQARRWPAMTSGIPSGQQRFVYAIGGDNGSVGSARSSGEFAQLDRFGNTKAWEFLPNDLPSGRTFAQASRVRDFVYLVGGHNGLTTTSAIHRAHVLDPLHTPDIDNVQFRFVPDGNGGLQPGTYYYKVSAVHQSNNSHNPDGETLTSDVQPVSIPDLGGRFDVRVKLDWAQFSNVKEYKVYRSPTPNNVIGNEQLLATIPAGTTELLDDGSMTTSSDTPIPVGSLGRWQKVGDLNTARERHGLTSVVDPDDQNTIYLYAVGGQGTVGNNLDTIEKVTITDPNVNVKRDQSVSSVTTTGATMSSQRTELQSVVATPANADNLSAGSAYLYGIGGESSGPGGGATGTVDYWAITGGSGNLGARQSGSSIIGQGRAGYGATMANNYALVFGGANSAPDDTGRNSNPVTATGDITGWNSLGGIDMTSRHRFGSTSLVGFFYMGGGVNGNGVLDSVEYSVVGTTNR